MKQNKQKTTDEKEKKSTIKGWLTLEVSIRYEIL